MNSANHPYQPDLADVLDDPATAIAPPEMPLSLPHKAELWSGRVAMIGFMTTAMAIAFKSTI
jgi:hypothetical protein